MGLVKQITEQMAMATEIDPKYKNASDSELRSIINAEHQIVLSITGNTAADVAEMAKHKGIADGCQKILDHRKYEKELKQKKKQDAANFVQKLNKQKDERLLKSVLNLKATISPNGCLVASILKEEDGKTRDEIASWCDELKMLEDNDFDALLKELVAEGTIVTYDEKYYLKNYVDSSLLPQITSYLPQVFFGRKGLVSNLSDKDVRILRFLRYIVSTEGAVKEDDLKELVEDYKYTGYSMDVSEDEIEDFKKYSVTRYSYLSMGIKHGIFMITKNKFEKYYYARFAGEKLNKETQSEYDSYVRNIR